MMTDQRHTLFVDYLRCGSHVDKEHFITIRGLY